MCCGGVACSEPGSGSVLPTETASSVELHRLPDVRWCTGSAQPHRSRVFDTSVRISHGEHKSAPLHGSGGC